MLVTIEESLLEGTWFVKRRFTFLIKFAEMDKTALKGTYSLSGGDGP